MKVDRGLILAALTAMVIRVAACFGVDTFEPEGPGELPLPEEQQEP